MDLTISRAEWLRGDDVASCLLRGDGKRCCVGIYLKALGVNDDALLGQEVANAVDGVPAAAGWLEDTLVGQSKAARFLYETNDQRVVSENIRETLIAARFAEHGVTVTFTD